jgi:hypothetical protein
MPAHTITVILFIAATFAFFAAIMIYGDLTWNRAARSGRSRGEARPRKEIGSAS